MAEQSRLEIAIDSRGAETKISNVRSELGRLERAGDTAARSADDVGQSFEDVARSAGMYRDASGRLREANGRFASSARQAEIRARSLGNELNRSSGGFRAIAGSSQLAVPPLRQMTSLLGGISAALITRSVIGYSDAWQNAGNQLRQVTDSAEELAGTQERLMQVANTTRSDFGSTANLYSRLARSTTELGLSQNDLIGLTRTINQSFATSGATAEEASAAITQLSQGLAAGALRGDEFNSVSEQAPGIMRAIAESLDMTIGDLRAFAAEGGITAEIVVNALQEASDSIEDDFGRAVATFGQQMTVARNNMIQFVGSSDSVEGALGNLGEAAVSLSENLDAVAQAGIVLGGVVAGRLAGRMITLAAGMTTAAGAATALRTALAFLGGPAGIAVAATTALFAFREELGLVLSPAQAAREEMGLLAESIEDVNDATIDGAMIQMNAKLFELERRAREAREKLDSLGDDRSSGALGMAAGATGESARLNAELGQISSDRAAIDQEIERLQALGEGIDKAGDSGDKAGDSLERLSQTAEDVVAKFKPMLNQDVEDILERAGPGSTIDDQGRIRDAYGNLNRVAQRELDAELQDQIKAFESEQNLAAGLEAAAQRFADGAEDAAEQAWGSVRPMSAQQVAGQSGGLIPTGDQSDVPALASSARRAAEGLDSVSESAEKATESVEDDLSGRSDLFSRDKDGQVQASGLGEIYLEFVKANGWLTSIKENTGSIRDALTGGDDPLMPTGNQDSAPALAGGGKLLGTLRLQSEEGGAIDVQAQSDELSKWLADTLSSTASSV